MVTLTVGESVYALGDCVWVFGYLGLILGSFMGFGAGCMSVGPPQGVYGFLGIFGSLFMGLRGSLSR